MPTYQKPQQGPVATYLTKKFRWYVVCGIVSLLLYIAMQLGWVK